VTTSFDTRSRWSKAFTAFVASVVLLVSAVRTARAADPPKRELPDYDGRGGEPKDAGDGALLTLRVVLSPLYFVTEYLVRRPIGALIAGAERAGLPGLLYDFFTFGPDHNAGIVPIAYIDLGFRANLGVYSFWDGAFVKGLDLRLRGLGWGTEAFSASFASRVHLSSDPYDRAVLEASFARAPDNVFFGLGPRSRQSDRVRYGTGTIEGRVGVDQRLWHSSSLHARVGVRTLEFRRGGLAGDPVLEDAVASGMFPPPPGYPADHTLGFVLFEGALDSRQKEAKHGSGVRVEVDGSYKNDLRYSDASWVTFGGAAGGFVDVNERRRVVSLSAAAHFAEPVGSATIPFVELVSLGGQHPMRAFYPGRLIDRSSAVAELAYRWPLWIWLDGAMRFEVGNVFGPGLRDFKLGLLRFSGSIGVESTGSPDNSLQILFGLGSETFESGGKIDAVRLVVGTTHGF
jgi:hypothetical protein